MFRHINILTAVAAFALSLGSASAFAGNANMYDFSTVNGAVTPTTIGLATFSSSSDPGAFTFGPNAGLYANLGAYTLSEAGFGGAILDISFAAPQTAVQFNFALGDMFASLGNETLTLTTNTGTIVTATAAIPTGSGDFYPEGVLSLSGINSFSSVAISSSTAYPITIADLTSVTAVPEPSEYMLMLMGIGLTGVFAARRKNKSTNISA